MSILDKITGLYAPFTCLGCEREDDKLLCNSCVGALAAVPSRCYRCRATTRNYEVCRRCRRDTPLRFVVVYAHYDDLAKELLHRSKYERAKQGFEEIGEMMSALLPYLGSDYVFVPVPTATSRVRQRGYDQAVLLAEYLSRLNGIPSKRLLARMGQEHQVGSTRKARVLHLRNAFRPVKTEFIKNAHIVLVDDVCTTGATLEAAARTLRAAGAKRVDAIVFAQPN